MTLLIPERLLDTIHTHGETAYPSEGVGLLLGTKENRHRRVLSILPLTNARDESARHHRYLITAEDMLYAEEEADKRDQRILGVFHSHPDHPNHPSEFDREYAIPWYSYLITSIENGKATGSKSWRLADDRSSFYEESIKLVEKKGD